MRKKLNYIAEICQNHKGKIKNVEKMIHDCAEAGANIVKMQYIFSKNLSFRPEFENGLKIKNKVYAIKRPFKKGLPIIFPPFINLLGQTTWYPS